MTRRPVQMNLFHRFSPPSNGSGTEFRFVTRMITQQVDPRRVNWSDRFLFDYLTGALTAAAVEVGARGFSDRRVRNQTKATLLALLTSERAANDLLAFLLAHSKTPTIENRDGFFWGQADYQAVKTGSTATTLVDHWKFIAELQAMAFPDQPNPTSLHEVGKTSINHDSTRET